MSKVETTIAPPGAGGPYRAASGDNLERAMVRSALAHSGAIDRTTSLTLRWEFGFEGGETHTEQILLTTDGQTRFKQLCAAVRIALPLDFDGADYDAAHRLVDVLKWRMCMVERQGGQIISYAKCDGEANTKEQRFERKKQCERADWDREVATRESTCRAEARMHNRAAERKGADKRDELRIRAALAALTGLIARSGYGVSGAPVHAKAALEYADAFVAATEKKEQEEKKND